MKKRYNEIMDKIEVTDVMRNRILQNIKQADVTATGNAKVVHFSSIKKYLSVAACFAVLLIGALTVPHLLNIGQDNEPGLMEPSDNIVTVSSVEELSDAVSFSVEEVEGLPFYSKEQAYVAYWSELAQITYIGERQTAVFRKSVGSEDNSGDFNYYPTIKEMSVGTITATLKGNSDIFTLAVWSNDNFSYSLQISDGLSAMEWESLITKIN